MQDDLSLRPDDEGVDVTADSPLPDVPDAGDDSQPLVPPEPVDISTATLATDGALVANTFGDPRTLYEQALDAYDDSDAGDGPSTDAASSAGTLDGVTSSADVASSARSSGRRVRIYNAQD